jgi:hypothetical protein
MFVAELSTNIGEAEPREGGVELEFRYHNHEQLTRYLRAVSAKYPALTALYSIGKSVQGNVSPYIEPTNK